MSNRKFLLILLCILLISVLSLSVAYAALGVVLRIQGNAAVVASNWNVYLNNPVVTSGSVTTNVPAITSPTTAKFSTTLNIPGDFYEFTIDLVNGGTIDAIIDEVVKVSDLNEEQSKYLSYTINYDKSSLVNGKPLLAANSSSQIKVRIEFLKNVALSDLPTSAIEIDLSFNVYCSQTNLLRYEDGEGNSNFGIIDENTYVYLASSAFNAAPGMTLYDAINDRIKDLSNHNVNDYSYYNLDGQWLYFNIEDGRRYNLKNTIIELGKTYYSSAWNYTVNVNDQYASDEKYNTVVVDVSYVKNMESAYYFPILASLNDTYLNVIHAVYPSFFTIAFDSSSIAAREQQILSDVVVAYPSGQQAGCGTTTAHEFYWFTDIDGNYVELSKAVNHLDFVKVYNYTIDGDTMTFEEAVAEFSKAISDELNK